MRLYTSASGDEEALITPTDRRVALIGLGATLVLIAGAYAAVDRAYPETIPVQTGRTHVEPLPGSQKVGVKVKHATYRVVERSLSLTLEVTNKAAQPIQLAELNTATVRFFNPEAGPVDLAYPEELSARTGLRVESNAPIAPGEIRTVQVTATDAAWDLQKLSTIIKGYRQSRWRVTLLLRHLGSTLFIEYFGVRCPSNGRWIDITTRLLHDIRVVKHERFQPSRLRVTYDREV